MKRAVGLAIAVTAVVSVAAAASQVKPNFAGKWTLVADPTVPGGRGMGGGLGQVFSAEQTDKALIVITTTRAGETKTVYNLDGSDSRNPLNFNGQSIDRVSRLKWDGAKLVIATTETFQGKPTEFTQTWSLDPAGNLIIQTSSNVGVDPAAARLTYKKG